MNKNAAVKFVPRFQRPVKADVMIVKEGNHQELKEQKIQDCEVIRKDIRDR